MDFPFQIGLTVIALTRCSGVTEGLALLRQFTFPEEPDHKRRDNHCRGQTCGCDETPVVFWCVDLLPDDEWQPSLENVGQFVHRAHDNSPFLVVVGTYLVRPRHAETAQPATAAGDDVARPVPADGDVPNRQARVGYDGDHATKDDRRPSRTSEDGIRRPRVDQRTDDLHRVRRRRIHIDLRHGECGMLRRLEILCEGGLADTRPGVVKGHVQRREEVDLPRGEDLLELGLGVGRSFCPPFQGHPPLRKLPLCRREVPRTRDLGHIGKQEEPGHGDGEGNDPIHDEQPLPASQAPFPVEVVYGRHQVPAEHGADGGTRVEDAGSFCKLVPPNAKTNISQIEKSQKSFVETPMLDSDTAGACLARKQKLGLGLGYNIPIPRSDHILHSWIERGFGKTDQETEGVDRIGAVAFGQTEGENSPGDFHGGNPDTWTDASEYHVCCGKAPGSAQSFRDRDGTNSQGTSPITYPTVQQVCM